MNRLNRFCTTLACISIIAACSTAFAYTIDTGFITFVQPNGVEFVGRQWSEGYVVKNRTDDGFEFIKGPEGYYYYAKLDERGDFTPSEFKVGIDDPVTNGIARGLNRTAERRAQIQDALERSASGDVEAAGKPTAVKVAPPSDVTIGIVLVEFNDIKGSSYTESDFEDMFFGSSYTGTSHPDGQTVYGSIATYWDQMSGSNLTITDAAVGGGPSGGILNPVYSGAPSWVPLAGNKAYYHTNYTMNGFRQEARNAAANMGINTTTSSTYRIVYIYAGNLYDQTPQAWPPSGCNGCGLTPHAVLDGNEYIFSELRDTNHATNARNCEGGGCATTPVFAHIGSHVHEIGHMFGLEHPHGPSGPSDVYFWSPMQSGDQSGGNIGSAPIALTPEEMRDLGFASFTTLSDRRDSLTLNAGTYYQIDYSPGHFVIEHRNGGGAFNNYLWDDAWNGSGLLLWFTDVNAAGSDDVNQCLIAADGDPSHLQDMFGDMFPGNESVTEINDETSPEPSDGTGITSGTDTHFALANIVNNTTTTTLDVFDNHFPDTPTEINLQTAEPRKQSINLSWQAHGSNPTHYIYYGTAHYVYSALDSVASGNTEDLISSLSNGTQYYFTVNSSEEFTNIPSVCRTDYDGDSDIIDYDDYFLFADHFGEEEGDPGYEQKYDLTGNRAVDYPDTTIFNSDFGLDCTTEVPKPVALLARGGQNRDAQATMEVQRHGKELVALIRVSDAHEVTGYGAQISYDPSMVELSKIEDLTRMLAIRGDDAYLSVARVRGNRVIVAATLKPGYQPVSGSEVLLKAFFNVIGESTEGEPVSLAETVLADANRTVDVIIGKSAAEEVAGNEYALKTFPNPSNPSTLIEFELPVASEVTLEVYNLLGQHIKTLVASEWKAAGVHQVAWDVRSDDGLTAATGIYLIRLHAGGEVFNQRITLVR